MLSFVTYHSQLVRFVLAYLKELPDINQLREKIESSNGNNDLFKQSVIITKMIINKIKDRAPGTKIIAFSTNETQPYNSAFKQIALSENIKFIDGIPEAVKAYEHKGFITRAADLEHWNELGHKIVADKICDYLVDHGYGPTGDLLASCNCEAPNCQRSGLATRAVPDS